MNLWVRTFGQLTILLVALFFFSCEDESSLLGFNPKQKFNVRYVDIPIGVSQVIGVDSVLTDLRPVVTSSGQQIVDGIFVGQFQDPDFGQLSAQPYVGVYPVSGTALNTTAVFDSATVQFRLNFYGYGFTGQRQFRIPVHEITGDTLTLYNGNRYYANSEAPEFNPEALGEAVVTVHYDSLKKLSTASSSAQDTILARARLNDEFGARLFDAIKGGVSTSEQHKLFRSQIRGLTLAPPTEPGVLGINLINSFGQLSRVTVHYHTLTDGGAVKDTLVAALGFEYASFTKVQVERGATELAGMVPYETVEPLSGQRYVQSSAGLITRLDLSSFYEFADTVENILVNSAELVISNVSGPNGLEPHNSLMLRLMSNTSNNFLNAKVTDDRSVAMNYYVLGGSTDPYYVVAAESGSAATLDYKADNGRFSGFLTLFAQSLYASRKDQDGINENRLRYVSLVPASPPVNRGLTRTLFNKDNVNLRIFYTRATTVSQ